MISQFHPGKLIEESEIYQAAKAVCAALVSNQYEAYMVGGCVRDFTFFPNLPPKDVDITTNATVEEIVKLFPTAVFVGNSFGVCIVNHDRFSFEVATFRKDGPYLDRRHPSFVSSGTLQEDSRRRDFTINALYFSPVDFKLIDLHEGSLDLKNKQLRCVGSADERIFEDALRILRALRFSTNFNLRIEDFLLAAIKKHADGLNVISKERIFDEISKVHNLDAFTEKFAQFLDISLFFESLSKKTKNDIKEIDLSSEMLRISKISGQSSFFDFFVVLLKYYNIKNVANLKTEIKALQCSTYDKKLCLWLANIMQIPIEPIAFFKELIEIERIEKKINQKFFLVLKRLISKGSFVRILMKYQKAREHFNKSQVIENLREKNIPEKQYSTLILDEYFAFVQTYEDKEQAVLQN